MGKQTRRLNYRNVIEAMEDGICIQTPDCDILYANKTFSNLVAIPVKRLINSSCEKLFDCRNGKVPPFCLRATGCLQENGNCERRAPERFAKTVYRLPGGADEPAHFLMQVRDSSLTCHQERFRARGEQMLHTLELAVGVAHEIKNPLAGIQGAIDILLERCPRVDDSHSILASIRQEAVRIDAVVKRLLAPIKLPVPSPAPISLTGLIADAINQVKDLLAQKLAAGQRLEIIFKPPSQNIHLHIDERQIRFAIENILQNAIEAIEGDGTISVRTHINNSTPRGSVTIEIEDTGPGIKAEHIKEIFLPFFTTKEHRMGIGLAAAHRIARQYGGHVDVISDIGHGSIFRLLLPLRQ